MHITKQLYWLMVAVIVLTTACQPKRNEAWLLENQDAIEEALQSNGLPFYTESVLENRLKNLKQYAKDFSKINYDNLSDTAKIYYLDLKHRIDFEIYCQDALNIFSWDATLYRITPHIKALAETKALEKDRFAKVNDILVLSDSFYQIAKKNITDAISITNGKVAVEQHASDFLYLQNDLSKQLEGSTIPDGFKNEITENLSNTMLNVKDYIGYVTSMINNTDDLDDTTKVIEDNRIAISMRKYLGKIASDFDKVKSIQTVLMPENAEILQREDYYFTLDEIDELEESGEETLSGVFVLLAQQELGIKHEEWTIPFLKILDDQRENMMTYPYRYAAQLENYMLYQVYKDDLKKQNKSDKLAALDNYIREFKNVPFIFIKQVLEE